MGRVGRGLIGSGLAGCVPLEAVAHASGRKQGSDPACGIALVAHGAAIGQGVARQMPGSVVFKAALLAQRVGDGSQLACARAAWRMPGVFGGAPGQAAGAGRGARQLPARGVFVVNARTG